MSYRYLTIAGVFGLMGAVGCAVTELSVPEDETPAPAPSASTRIGYLRDGRVAVASTNRILVFDAHLEAPQARLSFVLPLEAYPWYAEVAANGEVALVVWSTRPPGDLGGEPAPPVFFDIKRVSDGTQLQRVTLPFQTYAAALSPAGDLLATSVARDDGPKIEIYDLSDGSRLWSQRAGAAQFVFAPDGHALYANATDDSGFQAFDAYTGKAGITGVGTARNITVSPDGARVIGSGAAAVNVWDASDGSLERKVTQPANFAPYPSAAINRDGEVATVGLPIVDTGAGYSLQVWNDAGDLRYHVPFPDQTFFRNRLDFSPTAPELLVGTVSTTGDVSLTVFRVSDGSRVTSRALGADGVDRK